MNVIKKDNVEVIYIFGFITGDEKIKNFQIYMQDICFEEKEINEIATSYTLKNCS